MNNLPSVTQWSRICASDISREQTMSQAETTKAEWEEQKKQRKERETALLAAITEAREKNAGKTLDQRDWDSICGLEKDFQKSIEQYELIDRNKRRLDDQVRKLTEAELTLVHDARISEDLFNPRDITNDIAWKGIQLADLVGEMYSEHFTKVGIRTVGELVQADKDDKIPGHIAQGDFTREQVEFVTGTTYLVLEAMKCAGMLPKTWQADSTVLPEVPKKSKAEPDESTSDSNGAEGGAKPDDGDTDEADSDTEAKELTESDAIAISKYRGARATKSHEDPAKWVSGRFDEKPFADPSLNPLKLKADGGFYIDLFEDLHSYAKSNDVENPAALLKRIIVNYAARRPLFDSLDAKVGTFILDWTCRLQMLEPSTTVASFLMFASDGDTIAAIRKVSPLCAALAEREREVMGKGDGTESAPKGPQGGGAGQARKRGEAAARKPGKKVAKKPAAKASGKKKAKR